MSTSSLLVACSEAPWPHGPQGRGKLSGRIKKGPAAAEKRAAFCGAKSLGLQTIYERWFKMEAQKWCVNHGVLGKKAVWIRSMIPVLSSTRFWPPWRWRDKPRTEHHIWGRVVHVFYHFLSKNVISVEFLLSFVGSFGRSLTNMVVECCGYLMYLSKPPYLGSPWTSCMLSRSDSS